MKFNPMLTRCQRVFARSCFFLTGASLLEQAWNWLTVSAPRLHSISLSCMTVGASGLLLNEAAFFIIAKWERRNRGCAGTK